jgi:hypothetical protein
LSVHLHSHLEQTRDFAYGDQPTPALSHIYDVLRPIPGNKHAHGVLIRKNRNEIFRYSLPGGQFTTVIVKGKDPYDGRK